MLRVALDVGINWIDRRKTGHGMGATIDLVGVVDIVPLMDTPVHVHVT